MVSQAPQVWVVIAAYNEAPVIASVVADVKRAGYRALIIDDGSTDATGAVAAEAGGMLRVLYDEEAQIAELAGNLRHVFNYEKSIGFKYDEAFRSHWLKFGMDLIAYKHHGFREEKEIRLVHASGLVPENETFKIVALGARDEDGKRLIGPQEIRFRVSNGMVIPYVGLDYCDSGKQSPIKEVILGPRNDSAESNIQIFLNNIGVQGVRVRRSTVPYR
jgi:cellulose synthase/poly-beta-1,6-N-acetylglucosamine synthase-like glycosyltransferase